MEIGSCGNRVREIGSSRKGAFREDRYHATAVEDGEYLLQCLVFIDLNMVLTGRSGSKIRADKNIMEYLLTKTALSH